MNIYDIFGTCYKDYTKDVGLRSLQEGIINPKKKAYWTAADYMPWRFKGKPGRLGELPPCTFGGPIIEYLNSTEVMKQLNIPLDIPRYPGSYNQWDLCRSEDDGFFYESGKQASQWIYEAMMGKYRILKYSGDTDAAVPTTGTKWWIDELKLNILDDWRPWLVNDDDNGKILGGYLVEYEGLTLGTVHGAGHMAPQFKPRETHHLIYNWLSQDPI